jgi:replicative DNA helicase
MTEEVIPTTTADGTPIKYEFDEKFQRALVVLALRDINFMRRADSLLYPQHFDSNANAVLCKMAKDYYSKYKAPLDGSMLKEVLNDYKKAKILKESDLVEIIPILKEVYTNSTPLPPSEPIIDKLGEFARSSAVTCAIMKSVDLIEKRDWGKIEKSLRDSLSVGAEDDTSTYDYFAEIDKRTKIRENELAGLMPPRGITTGCKQLDDVLYRKGWGRKELSLIMAPAKGGKSMACIYFAKGACIHGHNVLYVTLEVATDIVSARLDACVTDTEMRELTNKSSEVKRRIEGVKSLKGRGLLHIKEYPSGSLKVSNLRRYLESARNKGVQYDLICVDYADLMAPEVKSPNQIENFRQIYVDLRALAFEYNCAILTATQTNREGAKAKVAEMTHVAEDFNKIRTADIVISINTTKEERLKGEARLYFVASRNQESGITLKIKQDIPKMQFISGFIGFEGETASTSTDPTAGVAGIPEDEEH